MSLELVLVEDDLVMEEEFSDNSMSLVSAWVSKGLVMKPELTN